MKKIVSVIMIIACAVCLFSACSGEKGKYEIKLTIVESMTRCDAVTDDWFFAYGDDGEWYKIVWSDTDGLNEGDTVTVSYDEITQISYETGYPDGYTPQKQIVAKSVKK